MPPSNGRSDAPRVRLGRMVEDGIAPSILGLIERGIVREPELAARMRGRVVFRFRDDFSPLRISFRPRTVVIEDGDLRRPDLVIAGRLPDIVHFATVPMLGGRLARRPGPAGGTRARGPRAGWPAAASRSTATGRSPGACSRLLAV